MKSQETKAKPTKIVVIDDDQGIRESLKDILALEGWECALAENGMEGMTLIQTLKPTLVVSDIQLPDVSGYQICREVKRDQDSKNTPVVLMTGRFTESQDKVQGLELGADEYFSKPFEPEFFISRIKSILRGMVPRAA